MSVRLPRFELEDAPALRDDYCEVAPYTGSSRIGEWAARVRGAALTRPGAAAAATFTLVAAGLVCFALRPVPVLTSDSRGPLLAHCGLSYYLFGHPNPAVRRACTAGYAGHATILIVTIPVVLAGLVLLSVAHRFIVVPSETTGRRRWRALLDSPARAAVASFGTCGVLIGLAALRTVPVHATASAGPVVIHCGVSYADFGTSVPGVHAICQKAFAVHNDFLLAGFLMALGAGMALALLVRTERRPDPSGSLAVAGAPGSPSLVTPAAVGVHAPGGMSS